MHHTKDKGDLAVLYVQLDLAKKGFSILNPLSEHLPFDLVAYDEKTSRFLRIQVKHRKINKIGCISLRFAGSWADKKGNHVVYIDKNAIDLWAIYCPDTNECYYFAPKQLLTQGITLRFKSSNNTVVESHYAKDFKELPKL